MSCTPDFHTDKAEVAPMNRNNCRGGDTENCMYYNSAGPGQSHYNYVAVQGAGAMDSNLYKCSSKAYDHYNDNKMYGDHALGGMGTYVEDYGEHNNAGLYGRIDFRDDKCSECIYGQRDMCDKCHLDKPDLYGNNGEPTPPPLPTFGLPKELIVVTAVALLYWAWRTGRVNLRDRTTQIALVAAAAYLFFFR